MGGSDMLMAPQYKNEFGTASIEVLTVPNAAPEEWETFKQEVADIWMSYEHEGAKLNSRPHWAKEWYVIMFVRLLQGGVNSYLGNRWRRMVLQFKSI